mmetsp:Transcript_70306/g.115540  ORF Transcript_70306/g.115540 Transcript_70306/m.115540 type:complete len:473 (-) Transcript_70306:130-1548(-)
MAFVGALKVVQKVANQVKDFTEDTGKKALDGVQKVAKDVKDLSEDVSKQALQPAWEKTLEGAKKIGKEVIELTEGTGKKALEGAQKVAKDAKDFSEDACQQTLEGAKKISKEVKDFSEDATRKMAPVGVNLREMGLDPLILANLTTASLLFDLPLLSLPLIGIGLSLSRRASARDAQDAQDAGDPSFESLVTRPFDHTQPYREVRNAGTLLWIPHTALPRDAVTESGYTDLSDLRPSNGEPQPVDPVPVIDLSQEFDMAQLGAEDVASVSDSTDDFTLVSSVFSADESASSEDRSLDTFPVETAPVMLLERMREFLAKEETFDSLAAGVLRVLLNPERPMGPVNICLACRPDLVLDLGGECHRGNVIKIYRKDGVNGNRNQRWELHGDSIRLAADDAWGLGGAAELEEVKLEDLEHQAAFVFEDGRIKLANHRQLCLDVCGGLLEDGSNVILYPVKPDDDEGRSNQLWILNA